MRILLLASAFNSLTQRIFVELDDVGHDVGCSVVADDGQMRTAVEAIEGSAGGSSPPAPLDYRRPEIEGRLERPCRQEDRRIDWSAPSAVILRHLRCSDSTPGVLDSLFGRQYYLFGGREERLLR